MGRTAGSQAEAQSAPPDTPMDVAVTVTETRVHLQYLQEHRVYEELDLREGIKPLSERWADKDDYSTAKAKLTARGYEQELTELEGCIFGAIDTTCPNHFKVCDDYWQDGDPTGKLRGTVEGHSGRFQPHRQRLGCRQQHGVGHRAGDFSRCPPLELQLTHKR